MTRKNSERGRTSADGKSRRLVVRCGARLGLLNATWPLVRFEASPENLIVDVFISGRHVLPRNSIAAVREHSGILSSGLLIERRDEATPVILWLDDVKGVSHTLREWGYPVEMTPVAPSSPLKNRHPAAAPRRSCA